MGSTTGMYMPTGQHTLFLMLDAPQSLNLYGESKDTITGNFIQNNHRQETTFPTFKQCQEHSI